MKIRLSAEAVARYGVKVEKAALGRPVPTLSAPAHVAFCAERTAHVGSPLAGRVTELRAPLGADVRRGDVLLVLASPDFGEAQSDYLTKRIAAASAGAVDELAQRALARAKGLYDRNGGIALSEVQKREGDRNSAQAAAAMARAASMTAENKLHMLGMDQAATDKLWSSGEVNPRFTLVAPIAGQVVEREVTLGELVSREKEALYILADVDTLWVLADVSEARIADVAIGAKAWIRASGLDLHKHEGQVSYIAPVVDPRTRTASVRVVVLCTDRSLKPGMFVQVEIATADRDHRDSQPVVAVPDDAIQTVEGRSVVFVPVANEENTFVKRPVTLGTPVAGLIPILSGLADGEKFVTAGSFILKAELGKGAAKDED